MSMIFRVTALTPSRLDELLGGSQSISSFLFPDDDADEDERTLDIDKSWHAIHFLLTGDPWDGEPPLSEVIMGGTEIGEDLGYGPARYLVADTVSRIAAALRAISVSDLGSRYSATRFNEAEIYPDSDWPEDWVIDDYFGGYDEQLRQFYRDAAQRGDCVILSLS